MKMKIGVFFFTLFLIVARSSAWEHTSKSGFLDMNGRMRGATLVAFVNPKEQNIEVEVCRQSDVSSFPAIRLIGPDDRQIRYRGPRKALFIQGFLRRTAWPAISHVDSKNVTAFQAIDDVVFVGHFGPPDTLLRRSFTKIAHTYHDRYTFATTVLDQRKHSRPMIECYNNPDGIQRSTTDIFRPLDLRNFIKLCSTPLIPELTRRNELSFYETRKSIVHYFVRDDKEREQYVTELRSLARKYEEYLQFVTTDLNEYPEAAEMMGLKRGVRGLSVQNPNNGNVYPYRRKEKITVGTVEAFLVNIIQGKFEPWAPEAGHDEL
ncbi:hypothetical protein VTI74DRAFT_7547 [Chaetomium olivicolor]